MKRLCYIVLSVLLTLPMVAQTNPPTPAAGYDFYFTLFDHWNENGNAVIQTNKYCGFTVCAIEAGDLTLSVPSSTGDKIFHFDTYNNLAGSLRNVNDAVLQGVHFHSTAACYLHVWVHSGTSGAETMILPKHLLGTKYMVQGVQGNSQFTVVGTENYTNVVITPKVPLRCVSRNNAIIPAGRPSGLFLQENEVLLFQPDDYTNDVSGTLVESDKVVAVFQGNTLTRIPATAEESDFVWEQALPTDTWGKEFIVPLSTRLVNNIYRITALYDDTDVYLYGDLGGKTLVTTLKAGETYERTLHTPLQELQIHHIETSQPTCCHLYTTGADINNNVGDPSMVQITPVDNMAKDTRWMLEQVENNSPWRFSLLVTTRLQDEANVKYNNIPLSSFQQDDGGAVSRMEKDGFVTYEIGISAYTASKMIAESGAGFSAYILRIGKTSEASAFNISLPACTHPPVLIEVPDSVPAGSQVTLSGTHDNNCEFLEPKEYQWYFSQDSIDWYPIQGAITPEWTMTAYDPTYNGWYKLAVFDAGDRGGTHSAVSEPQWMEVLPYDLCEDGQLLYFIPSTSTSYWSYYSKTISGFYPGSTISFSVVTKYPILLYLTHDPSSTELIHYEENVDTPIGFHKVGITYTIPDGIDEITFSTSSAHIANVDSFEVRLCVPPVTIEAPDTVCVDTKNIFRALFENDGSFTEPLEYQWYFSADSLTWTPLTEGTESELKLKAKPRHTGWYKVAVSGTGNVENELCRSVSEPFKFFVIEDCPPILCPEGILIHDETQDGSESTYSADLTDLCEHMDLSFIVNLQPDHPENRLLLRFTDMDTDQELAAYDTGDIPADSLQVGTTFTVPVGISNIRWSIRNNESGASGTPLYLSEVETRLCLEPISISNIDDPACRKQPYSFHAEYENYDILRNPEYQWYYSATQDGAYTEIDGASELVYTIDTVHKYHEGWYKVAVSETGWMAYSKCRSISEPFHLETQYCNTAVEQYWDTTACDTLLAYSLAWREHIWSTTGSVVDTLTDIDDDDSLYVHKTLRTKICCPDIQYITIDSAICDTLMPFLWFFRDTMLLYEQTGIQQLEYRHHRWENCTGEVFTLSLDTFHCERLYPIIVNKYNWQLLLDYPALRRFFPDRQFLAFQWYKNGEPIPGATGDDYSEQNELCGVFQLQIQLDQAVDNDDQYIWSTILEIGEPQAPLPVTKRIYNWSGMLVNEEPMRRGLYLIVYRQGDKTWTEKKIVL